MNERIIEIVDLGTDEQLMVSIDVNAQISVGDEQVWSISALGDGIVALTTTIRTVHIGAADFWRLLHGDMPPSMHQAGYLAARLAHVQSHAHELIEQLVGEGLLDHVYYPSIFEAAAGLETAMGVPAANQPVEV